MRIPTYLANIGIALERVFFGREGDSLGKRMNRLGFSIAYPPLRGLQQAGFSQMSDDKIAGIRMLYSQMFPGECDLSPRRIFDEATVCIPSYRERTAIAKRLHTQRESEPHYMGGMNMSSRYEDSSRRNWLTQARLNRLSGRFVSP